MQALGRLFDIGLGFTAVDINTANSATGKRVSLKNATGCSILVHKAAGTAGDDPTLTLKQYTAASGGTTANLASIDQYYIKGETTLDNDESWTKVTQTAAATITDPGGTGVSAETEMLIVIPVSANSLSDGYAWIGLDYAVAGLANAQLAACFYILHDLAVQRTPANLGNLLNPGAANA
jgi:hypothetical protein